MGLLGGGAVEDGGGSLYVAGCRRHELDEALGGPGDAVCRGFPDVDASGAGGLGGGPVGFADV